MLFVLVFLTSHCFSQSIRGRVVDTDTQKPLLDSHVYVLITDISSDTVNQYYWHDKKFKIIRQTRTDDSGKFRFTSLDPNIYTVIVEFKMPVSQKYGGFCFRQDIDSNVAVDRATRYYKSFSLLATCPFDKTKNQTFCPICKKSDKVVPIVYGLPIYDSNGRIDGKPEDETWPGGCSPDLYCNPSKHCKRCNKEF